MIFRMVYKSGQIFLPFCHNSRVWRTDRISIAIPRLHSAFIVFPILYPCRILRHA